MNDITKVSESILESLNKLSSSLVADNFRYYNSNPNKNKTSDCVVRSISTALNKSWEDVLKELTEYALKHKHFPNCQEIYEIYLKDNKWKKHNAPHKRNGDVYLLGEWLKKFGDEAIVTIDDDHLTYVNNHIVYDIWNCTENEVGVFWTEK